MITMFRKIRRPLLGLAVIASSIVVVPIAASVVNASDGTMDNTTWGAAGGGRVLINTEFTEPGGNVRFTATAGFLMDNPSGALLLAGYTGAAGTDSQRFATLVLANNGNPLNTFSSDGLTVYDLPNSGSTQYARGAAEKIYKVGTDYVLAGWVGPNESNGNPAMLRVTGTNMAKNVTDWSGGSNPGWIIVTDGIKVSGGGSDTGVTIPGASFAFNASTGFVMSTDATNSALTRVSQYNLVTGAEETVGMGSGSKTFDTATEFGTNRAVSSFTRTFTNTLGVGLLVATKPTTTASVNDRAELVGLDISGPAPTRSSNYNNGAVMTTTIRAKVLSSITSLDFNSFMLAGSDGSDTYVVKISKSNVSVGTHVSITNFDLTTGGVAATISNSDPLLVGRGSGLTTVMRLVGNDLSADSSFNSSTDVGQVIGARRISVACSASGYSSMIIPGTNNSFWVLQKQWGTGNSEYGASVLKFAGNGMSSTACPVFPPLEVFGMFSINGSTGSTASMSTPMPIGAISGYTTYTYSVLTGSSTPCGLTLNTQTGKFEGSITSIANGSVTVRVTNNAPTQQSGTFNVTYSCIGGGIVGSPIGGGTQCVAGTPSSTNSAVTFDSAFAGDGGYDFSGQLLTSKYGNAAKGPNGSLYVAVSVGSVNTNSPTNKTTQVLRFLADGTQSTWGSASVDVDASTSYSENAIRLLVLSDGSVVMLIMGQTGALSDYKLAKFTSAGALDTNFGINGLATLVSGSTTVTLGSLAEGPAVSIYVGTSTRTGSYPNYSNTSGIIKVSALGVVDSAFGTSGELTVTSQAMATDSTGALYVGGLTNSSPANATVVKYTTSGVIDTTFGVGGVVELNTSTGSSNENLGGLVFANGKISGTVYVQTVANNSTSYATSAFRISTDGVLDASFDNDGVASIGTLGGMPRDITVLPDGGLILPFGVYANQSTTLGLVGVLANGTPVTSLVTSPANISSGTCVLRAGSIFATSAGIFAAGTSGNQTVASHIFKISISGMAAGAASGGDSGSTPDSGSSTGSSGNTSSSTPAPTLVTSANAAALVRAPGSESIIINGEEVVIESNTVNIPAARTPAAQRTPAQVNSIQQAGAALLQQFLASLPAGATSNVAVVNTATGAVMQNLVFDANGNSVNVPVEDIVFLDGPQLSLMIGSNNANITADGKYQVGAGGIVGVTGSGLGVSASGEIIAMSTPTLLANFQTTAAGDFNQSATLPSSIGVGDHTLVVASGSTYAMMGIRVVPAALPTTGATTDRVVIIALFTLVFGALFFRGRRTFAL